MDTKGNQTRILLSNILKAPNTENYEAMVAFVASSIGFDDFCYTVKHNNALSLIFLKNYLQQWIEQNTMKFLYDTDFLNFIVEACRTGDITKNNFVHVAGYLEILSNNYLVPLDILAILINNCLWVLIDAVFKKYVNHPRSNRLFTEINLTIPMFFPVFVDMFFCPVILKDIDLKYNQVLEDAKALAMNMEYKKLTVDFEKLCSEFNKDQRSILSIFYSLTYQDIHPLFEDHADHFFKVFFILFDHNHTIINLIFDLFITKYPEITNFQLIVLTLSRFDSLDPLAVSTLTKAYTFSKLFPNAVLNFLQRNLHIQMNDDWYSNTQNFLKGNDIQRGFTHKLIRILQCSVYSFTDEPMFFVASLLKYKDSDIINRALGLINSKPGCADTALCFSAYAYLITIQEYHSCNIEHIDTDLKYICAKYISNTIKTMDQSQLLIINKTRESNRHLTFLEKIQLMNSDGIKACFNTRALFIKTVTSLEKSQDEYFAELLFRIVKNCTEYLTNELYDLLTNLLLDKIQSTSVYALHFLFDVYMLLSVILQKYNSALIQKILENDIVDTFNLCFYYISVMTGETGVQAKFVDFILAQEAFWKSKDVHPGLSCILISAYKKGIVGKERVKDFVPYLDGFNRAFVLSKTATHLIENDSFSPEESYLINDVLDQTYFTENYLNKKYVRMVIKKMMETKSPILQLLLEKNKAGVEFENYLFTIALYFDI